MIQPEFIHELVDMGRAFSRVQKPILEVTIGLFLVFL